MADVRLLINAKPSTARSGQSTLTAIRDELGIKSPKLVCGVGGCGACVVLIDGIPTETCTLPIESLEGKEVVTVEGLTPDGSLTALQKAMIAHDAVQCGFCTPGLVISAETFVTGWTSANSTMPTRGDVELALDGHLCRCGAYPGIVKAVQAAANGEYVDGPTPTGRPDAPSKLDGSARFTVDVELGGMLEARLVRSTRPNAKVLSIESSAALSIEGVTTVIDLLDKDRRVRYTGQPVAAVVGNDASIARFAAGLVDVTYQDMAAAIGMEAAREEDAPDMIDGRLFVKSNYEAALVAATVPRRGNMRGPTSLLSKRRFTARKRLDEARESEAKGLLRGTWRAASQSNAAPEPHSAVASWDHDRLTIYLSTQAVSATAGQLARHFGVPRHQVVVHCENLGGAFGAKQALPDPAVHAAFLAKETGRPVRLVYDPEEELAYGGYRPGAEIELSVSVDESLSLRAIRADSYTDSGDSAGQTVVGLMRLSYPGPPMDLNDHDVISNGSPAKPFQAPGAPIALFALESAVDELAGRLDTDPITLRRHWNPRKGRTLLYDWVESHPLWESRTVAVEAKTRRGVGVAFGTWHYAYDPSTVVRVSNDSSGLTVSCAVQEIGTGAAMTLATAVASVFGVDTTEIRVRMGDSSLPRGPISSASRTTASIYPTAHAAATTLIGKLVRSGHDVGLDGAEYVPGGLQHSGEFLPWAELWPRLGAMDAYAGRPKDSKMSPMLVAVEGAKFGRGVSDGAHIVEVEVDQLTGVVRVTRVAVALAAGTIHTPAQARSQVHGALARGIGEALYEERLTDRESGVVTTASYDRYRIMRMSEMPEVEVVFFEEGFDHAPGGGIGVAELAIASVPGAVANAVADATGWRPRKMPITPERVAAALRADTG
jgi:xanthine dehydrogenase YagR molybdenum-binding subunit